MTAPRRPPPPATPAADPVAVAPAAELPTDAEVRKYWPRFRGPGGAGVSAYTNLPDRVGRRLGREHRLEDAGPAAGQQLAGRLGRSRVPHRRDRETAARSTASTPTTGKLLWSKPMPGTPESTAEPPKVDGRHRATPPRRWPPTAAASTPSSPTATWPPSISTASCVWSRSLGMPENIYGHAASLVDVREPAARPVRPGRRPRTASRSCWPWTPRPGKTVWEAPREVPNSWAIADRRPRTPTATRSSPRPTRG